MKKIALFVLIGISIFLVASPCNNEFYITNDALGAKINPNISNDSFLCESTGEEFNANEILLDNIVIPTGSVQQEIQLFLDNYSTHYFYNLSSNFAFNHIGTCGYVSAAMLLSYYDSYWNDHIICDDDYQHSNCDDSYDQPSTNFNSNLPISNVTSSPGIIGDEGVIDPLITNAGLPREYKFSASEYNLIVTEHSNTHFHFELIRLGRDNLHLPFGLHTWEIKELLEHYLYDIKGFASSDVEVEYIATPANIRAYTIDKINQGIPVILTAANANLKGHAFIAYDYNDETDELYCHLGGKNGLYHVALSTTGYIVLGGAITIEFNNEHSHSNNYVSSDGDSYCSCYFPCHPEHECTYEMYNESQHIYTCGHVANENNKSVHQLEYIDVFGNDTSHIVRCAQCNYSYTATHNYSCEYVDVNTHTGVCVDCGYEATLSHTYDKYKSVDAFYHKSACSCGATTGGNLGHIWTSSNIIGYAECKMCKYLKSSAGGNIAIIKEKSPVIEEVTE